MKKFLLLTTILCAFSVTGFSSEDDSVDSTNDSPKAVTVFIMIQGGWLRVGTVIEDQEQYYDEPCVNYNLLAEGKFQVRWCDNVTTFGHYILLDDEHIELEDYNKDEDDTIAIILELNEGKMILSWIEKSGDEVIYIFGKSE